MINVTSECLGSCTWTSKKCKSSSNAVNNNHQVTIQLVYAWVLYSYKMGVTMKRNEDVKFRIFFIWLLGGKQVFFNLESWSLHSIDWSSEAFEDCRLKITTKKDVSPNETRKAMLDVLLKENRVVGVPAEKTREKLIVRERDNHLKKKRQLGIWLWDKNGEWGNKSRNTMGNKWSSDWWRAVKALCGAGSALSHREFMSSWRQPQEEVTSSLDQSMSHDAILFVIKEVLCLRRTSETSSVQNEQCRGRFLWLEC